LKTIIVGSGGREHALGYKVAEGGGARELLFLPGNGGTVQAGRNANVGADDVDGVAAFCREHAPDLVIVGPEDPLAAGLSDRLAAEGARVFGPTAACARLETSKAYAKEFMAKYAVPTARFDVFADPASAHAYVEASGGSVVVKADGLARGKGAIVTDSKEEAHRAVARVMEERVFGEAGDTVVIEERLRGEEVSVIAVTDGENYVMLPPSQDHKPVHDGDRGPNTGGMGAYCPVPLVTKDMFSEIEDVVFKRTLKGLRAEGLRYRGVIYAGLMINREGIFVIEFNARFGDPETQAMLPVIDLDLGELLMRAADGRLGHNYVVRAPRWAVCVVLSSAGYPRAYETGKVITGLKEASSGEGVMLFHAGTRLAEDGVLLTSGGRVMGVTGCGGSLREAQRRAYEACSLVEFEGKYMRKDIGDKGMKRLRKTEVT
jgi:phosphoribosylamine--glycine ligase